MKQIFNPTRNFPFIKKTNFMKTLTLKSKILWAAVVLCSASALLSFSVFSENIFTENIRSGVFQQSKENPGSNYTHLIFTDMKFDYDTAWIEILKLEREGLPKSALEKTNTLLGHARKDGRHDHFIKALIYKGKYESQLEEDGLANAIYKMQQEMEQSEFPVKPILQSMLA